MVKPKKVRKTAEEIRLQKRECERKRRARIKADAALYEASKAKDRARYSEKKQKQQIKLVSDMTPREHRNQRKEWKERKARSRLKQKRTKTLLAHLRENTPDTTDDEAHSLNRSPSILINLPKENEAGLREITTPTRSSRSAPVSVAGEDGSSSSRAVCQSRQKMAGLKLARQTREQASFIISKQKKQLQVLKQKVHTLQVKLLREGAKKRKIITKKKSPHYINKTSKVKMIRTAVTDFLERDDNSKLCPGKKDCVVKNKLKKQKRYLADTMVNLYKKYQSEQESIKISLATFCRLRPFWVVPRNISERDTCLCVVHENIQLMFNKLKCLDIISGQNLRELCKTIVCDMNKEACMLRKCEICKNRVPMIREFDDSTETTYKLWTVIKEKRLIQGKEKEIRRTVKAEFNIQKKKLILKFLNALDKFLVHEYNITHQYKAITALKSNLKIGDIFMQVDFSENYCCKYANEIQAVHFGASRQQINLHTGVYYYKCPDTQMIKCVSFCTFSECLRHDASAVFAHMQKILDHIRTLHPMDSLHVLSDGPTAQYRNKKAFYLFTQRVTQLYGLKTATWSFSEAGHGKGPMDGVGAVIKRTADRIVAQGEDIPDFVSFVKSLEKNVNNVTMFVVNETQIDAMDKLLPDLGKSIPGTMKIHQITWDLSHSNRVFLRTLTCLTCRPGEVCIHHKLGTGFYDFTNDPPIIIQENGMASEATNNSGSTYDLSTVPESIIITEEQSGNAHSAALLKEGMWVVTRFLSKKTEQHFVGQIIGFEGIEPKVKFTKKIRIISKHTIFCWIEPEDIFPVPCNDVVAVLIEPTPGRRGELLFNNVDIEKYSNVL